MLVPEIDTVGKKVSVDGLWLGVVVLHQVQHLPVLGLLGSEKVGWGQNRSVGVRTGMLGLEQVCWG